MTHTQLQPFGDPHNEAQMLLGHYSPAMVIEWIGRYEFLIQQLEDAKRGGLSNLDRLIEHANTVLEVLKANCKAGTRID
jgi:hypothetical protein